VRHSGVFLAADVAGLGVLKSHSVVVIVEEEVGKGSEDKAARPAVAAGIDIMVNSHPMTAAMVVDKTQPGYIDLMVAVGIQYSDS
jgi:stage III sporulation protein SpoIIIAA